jgi:hypothetical protein
MSNLSIKRLQVGNSTAGNNFVIRQPDAADATLRISNGNIGTTTDLVTINSTGTIGVGTTAPSTKLHINDLGAVIIGGNAIYGSTMKGITLSNSANGDESVGLWFGTGPTSHWSGISGQRSASATTWGTDLRFYTHEDTTVDLTYARQRMRIDASGRVTKPYQTAFRAFAGSNIDYATSDTKITVHDQIAYNVGSNYSTSTTRFTAPVAGVYMFIGRAWSRLGNTTEAGICFKKNGGAIGTLRIGSSRDGYSTLQPVVTVSLAVNDYVELFTETCTATGVVHTSSGDTNSMFAGYLLG